MTSTDLLGTVMALLRYFRPRDGLPDLQGSLSLSVPLQPIARTNREVEEAIYSQVEGMKRGPYVSTLVTMA